MSYSDILVLVVFVFLSSYAIWKLNNRKPYSPRKPYRYYDWYEAHKQKPLRQPRSSQEAPTPTAVIRPPMITLPHKAYERQYILHADSIALLPKLSLASSDPEQTAKSYTEFPVWLSPHNINIEGLAAKQREQLLVLLRVHEWEQNQKKIAAQKAIIDEEMARNIFLRSSVSDKKQKAQIYVELKNEQLQNTINQLSGLLVDVVSNQPETSAESPNRVIIAAIKCFIKHRQLKIPIDKAPDVLYRVEADFNAAKTDAIVQCFTFILEASDYPGNFPQHIKVAYVPESKQLVVEYDLPGLDVVPEVLEYKYVAKTDEITSKPRPEKQRKTLYASIVSQITLRVLYELFRADSLEHLDTIVFNGMVDAIDKGTGRKVRPCLITVRTTRDVFQGLDLTQVDPDACLKVLSASVSKSPAELAPVRPVLEFNMVDPRFVQEIDVLSTLDQRPNLMELTPSEFESLITNLFEKMGLETRLTQASRDGGVDCVAYDPRPILGGKIVIQAKRYKHTVGVSAVRDLFGTMHNEGASKGILVTTSGFGKASFEFASDKPIELLGGSNLLYLLSQHAGIEAKIVPPESWKDPQSDVSSEPIYDPKKPTE